MSMLYDSNFFFQCLTFKVRSQDKKADFFSIIKLLTSQGEDRISNDSYVDNYGELLSRCNKNHLSKSLLLMQRSLLLSDDVGYSKEQKKLLEVFYIVMKLIRFLSENLVSMTS